VKEMMRIGSDEIGITMKSFLDFITKYDSEIYVTISLTRQTNT